MTKITFYINLESIIVRKIAIITFLIIFINVYFTIWNKIIIVERILNTFCQILMHITLIRSYFFDIQCSWFFMWYVISDELLNTSYHIFMHKNESSWYDNLSFSFMKNKSMKWIIYNLFLWVLKYFISLDQCFYFIYFWFFLLHGTFKFMIKLLWHNKIMMMKNRVKNIFVSFLIYLMTQTKISIKSNRPK